ncbi:MAG: hypothetical protein ABIJ86_07680 [Spirochaetota bacterium]
MYNSRYVLKIKLLIILGLVIINSMAFAESSSLSQEFHHFDFSLLNNGLFILPPLIWNIAFISKTPTYYSSGSAPSALLVTENILRAATFIAPFFIPINNGHKLFYPGLTVYSIGLGVYFSSWLLLMYAPDLKICTSKIMRLMPAITPVFWLVGIGMMAETPVSYSLLSTGFLTTHVGEYLFRFNIIDIHY